MNCPNGALLSFWPDLENWQTGVQLTKHNISLGLLSVKSRNLLHHK